MSGAADHTWTYMFQRRTNRSFRYAAAVTFFSHMQFRYWYDGRPYGSEIDNPVPELWDNLPTVWDDTRFVQAKMRSHGTVARQSGQEWWIGSITASARTATIPLNFLTPGVKYRAAIFEADPGNVITVQRTHEVLVDSTTTLKPFIPTSSGYAVRLSPVKNLAVDKLADQSSTRAAGGEASRAVDGNTNGDFAGNSVTHTDAAQTTAPWWRVDLGSVRNLSSIEVFNRTDGTNGDRLTDYWVFVSDIPFNTALTPLQQRDQPGVWSVHNTTQAGTPTNVPLPAGTNGRHIMVQLNGTGILSLAEVPAWA